MPAARQDVLFSCRKRVIGRVGGWWARAGARPGPRGLRPLLRMGGFPLGKGRVLRGASGVAPRGWAHGLAGAWALARRPPGSALLLQEDAPFGVCVEGGVLHVHALRTRHLPAAHQNVLFSAGKCRFLGMDRDGWWAWMVLARASCSHSCLSEMHCFPAGNAWFCTSRGAAVSCGSAWGSPEPSLMPNDARCVFAGIMQCFANRRPVPTDPMASRRPCHQILWHRAGRAIRSSGSFPQVQTIFGASNFYPLQWEHGGV